MLRQKRRGATAIEYALVAAGIFLVFLLAAYHLSQKTELMWNSISSSMEHPPPS